jgi:hypothetical protein
VGEAVEEESSDEIAGHLIEEAAGAGVALLLLLSQARPPRGG